MTETAPALEYHFTLDETLEIMARTPTRQLIGARWYVTMPALEDLREGAGLAAGMSVDDVLRDDRICGVLLWGYPVHVIAGSKAIVYFGQGVL